MRRGSCKDASWGTRRYLGPVFFDFQVDSFYYCQGLYLRNTKCLMRLCKSNDEVHGDNPCLRERGDGELNRTGPWDSD